MIQVASDDAKEARFDLVPYAAHKVEPPAPEAYASADELFHYFTQMYRLRRMEMEADALYTRSKVRGFCHLYNGQEAVAVGIEAAITRDDCLITSYRNHCQLVTRGGSVREVLSELTGRTTGASKGKGGSMHLYRPQANYFGGNGIVGAQTPIAAGLALAQKYSDANAIAIGMFGDGAANQGQLAEAINLAKIWDLPCVFVCENNQYGMGTSAERSSASVDYYTRGDYIAGLRVDGMDVLAVREGIRFARDYVLSKGPMYIEMNTYRYKGHSISDQGLSYRSADEINDIRSSRDPIDRVKLRLVDNGWATAGELKAEEKKIRKEVDQDVKAAEAAPIPEDKDLFNDVYVGEQPFIRGTLLTNGNMPPPK